MQVLGREVALVGVTLAALQAHHVPGREICQEIFAHHTYYSAANLRRDVPEFHPVMALPAGMRQVFAAMEREGRIPRAESEGWEDHLIAPHSTPAPARTGDVATHDGTVTPAIGGQLGRPGGKLRRDPI